MIVSGKKHGEFLIGKTRDCGDAHFDPDKRRVRFENGLHPIRDSFWYAISLFEDGSEEVFERAEAIVWAVLGQQEKHANHPRKGAFKLWAEDSESVDFNWADFNACNLPEMLFCHGQRPFAGIGARCFSEIHHYGSALLRSCYFRRRIIGK